MRAGLRSRFAVLSLFAVPLVLAACAVELGPDDGGDEPGEETPTTLVLAAPSLYNQEFESDAWKTPFSSIGALSNTIRVAAGYKGAGLRTRFASGTHYGGTMSLRLKDLGKAEPDAVYFRYYLKLGSNWKPGDRHTGKIPGIADLNGTNRCRGGKAPTAAEPCWSSRMMWRQVGTQSSPRTDVGFYTYHAAQKGTFGDGNMFSAAGYTPLVNNRWYCIEGYAKMNDPALANGVLKGWVNGKPALTRSDLRFRTSTGLHVEQFWYDIYYGGQPVVPQDMDVYVDRVALSTSRIGCDSNPDDPMWEPGAENQLFKDMPPGTLGQKEAIKLYDQGITKGCRTAPDPMFCPRAAVTRSQMAAFLVRALDLPPATRDYFTDDAGSTFEDDHNRLRQAGITTGCTSTTFCGTRAVTRGEMAAFLARAFKLPATSTDYFTDDETSTFEASINALAKAGITTGCGTKLYCPNATLTRAQMAVFLVRALGL